VVNENRAQQQAEVRKEKPMAKRKKPVGKSRKKKSRKKPGMSLEQAVARVQQLMDPNTTVARNEKIIDRLGHENECDVVVRGSFGGRPILGIIECKDHSRKKGRNEVRDFAGKCDHLGASVRIIVSKKGFTGPALELARHEHIDCLSLLPGEQQNAGFSVGSWWYGLISKWQGGPLTVHFDGALPAIPPFRSESVLWQGKPVINWFLREFLTKYGDRTVEGECVLNVQFDEVRHLTIAGEDYPVRALSCTATRIHRKKRKWVSYTGDAFIDWHEGNINLPAGANIVSSAVATNLSLWDEYDGPIPGFDGKPAPVPERNKIQMVDFLHMVFLDVQKWEPSKEVPDLDQL
jgi:hypothetical protein